MAKFKKHKPRFDIKVANEGREIYAEDMHGTYYGTFRVALVDTSLPRVRKAAERIQFTPVNGPIGAKSDVKDIERVVRVFIEVALLDWRDVLDEDDKQIPFTKDNAFEFFTQFEIDESSGERYYTYIWLLNQLSRESENFHNFQPSEQKELPEKN
jgi:hypothetical protein